MRDKSIDILKGCAIIMVIASHSLRGVPPQVVTLLYATHLPIFFFVAGYLYKGRRPDFAKDFRRLIVPYLLTGLACSLIGIVKAIGKGQPVFLQDQLLALFWANGSPDHPMALSFSGRPVPPVGSIWFLPALFWCKNVYAFICSHVSDVAKRFGLSLALSVCAIIVECYVVCLPTSLCPGLAAIVFFAVGDVAKSRSLSPNFWHGLVGAVALVYCVMFSHLYMERCYYGCYPADVAGALFAIFVFRRMAASAASSKVSTPLCWCGRESLAILCCHVIDAQAGFSGKVTELVGNEHLLFPFALTIAAALALAVSRVPVVNRIF